MKLTSPSLSSGASARKAISTPTALGSATWRSGQPVVAAARHRPMLAELALAGCGFRHGAPQPSWAKMSCFGPAGEVEQRAMRQEVEAGLGELDAVLALQPLVELVP